LKPFWARIGVFGIIEDNSFLLSLRWDGQGWNLPGGAMEPKENWEDALKREIKEETGLEVKSEKLVGIYLGSRVPTVAFCFKCKIVGGKFKESVTGEVKRNHYFTWPEIEELYKKNQLLRIHFWMLEDCCSSKGPIMRDRNGQIVC